ncbi:uncharacterized protein N7443_008515 [Penicillium atrosanguineum]|uniref:uncharacterized protein n=1 Tax=Penicillium atrosanguineum TaxID=1132637 RepID=UPI002386BE69|nr:uncharacterized protein N7443_008515 [Penicillium atrosanguineum]KAJ5125446.1 hypothetical protein N7526_007623 [Penicillium atrosanguineum]KAJ5292562.1 hypothetical protein N7443_008515 [Penicillium atrosanguineum]
MPCLSWPSFVWGNRYFGFQGRAQGFAETDERRVLTAVYRIAAMPAMETLLNMALDYGRLGMLGISSFCLKEVPRELTLGVALDRINGAQGEKIIPQISSRWSHGTAIGKTVK